MTRARRSHLRVAGEPNRRRASFLYDDAGTQVRRDPDRVTGRTLLHHGMEASYVDLADPRHLEFGYVRRFVDAISLRYPGSTALDVVHIGGGGFTLPRYLVTTRAAGTSTVFESDPVVVAVARRYLGLQESARLRVTVGDARALLSELPAESADVVIGDAFVQGLVPAHLATREFAAEVARVLRPDGTYLLNVVDSQPLQIARSIGAAVQGTFDEVIMAAPNQVLNGPTPGNLLFLGSRKPWNDIQDALALRAGRDRDEPFLVLDREETATFTAGAEPLVDIIR